MASDEESPMSPDPDGDKSSSLMSSSSPPSAGIANLPRPPTINGHNRDITEHTASLMSLFARPASPPKTPITPAGFGSSTTNSINMNYMSGMPLLPCSSPNVPPDEMDFQRMPLNVRTSNHQADNNPKVYSSGSGSFISTDNSLKDTIRITNTDHNRDETMLAQNLTNKEKDTIADVFACTPTRGNKASVGGGASNLLDLVTAPNIGGKDYSTFSSRDDSSRLPFLRAISERSDKEETALLSASGSDKSIHNHDDANNRQSFMSKAKNYISANTCDSKQIKTTFIGALLYSLYSLVFCFAEASAITRPSHPNSEESGLLAPMALMGAVRLVLL